ncbi:MAG: sigma-70 family RNA polymerase sigma factor [Gemmataceae bacterium]|nr:sigma-70 family RNA polymerase sigma factor [Gemmataceae bacterium]
MHTTSLTLLERVSGGADPDAWVRFVRLYSPLIYHWARRCGLQECDAADLAQDVFAGLLRKLPAFAYAPGGSFRSWLRAFTLNLWRDRLRRVATRPLPCLGQLDDVSAPEILAMLDEEEHRRQLVGRALESIRPAFQAATWTAFWEHGVRERPAADVARETGLSLASVYGAKFRVLQRLREELGDLADS